MDVITLNNLHLNYDSVINYLVIVENQLFFLFINLEGVGFWVCGVEFFCLLFLNTILFPN